MTSIFELVGSVLIDNTKADESLSKTDKKAGGLAETLSKGAEKAGKFALGLGAAAAGAGAAIYGMAMNTATAADEIDKGSIRMGISTESYQELRYAAGQCGVEMSTMEKAAKKLEGTDINFDDAIKSIMSLSTEEERSAKAAELFGESVAYQMAPLLSAGGEAFDDLKENAHNLGLIMGEDAVSAGVKLDDTMSDVKQSLGAVGTSLGTELMPVVQKVLDWVLEHMPEIQETIGNVMDFVGEFVQTVVDLAQELYEMIEPYIPQIIELVQNVVDGIVNLWENVLKPALNALIEFCVETLFPAVSKAFNDIKPVVEAVFNGIVQVWDTILKPAFEGIITFITGVFTGDWQKAWEGVIQIFDSIFGGIVDLVKKPLNKVIELINGFFDSLGEIHIPDWVPIIGGETFSLPNIPYLAKGGNIVRSGTAIVGEAGPELINLPAGASVVPLGGGSDFGRKLDAIIELLAQLCEKDARIEIDGKEVANVVSKELGEIL